MPRRRHRTDITTLGLNQCHHTQDQTSFTASVPNQCHHSSTSISITAPVLNQCYHTSTRTSIITPVQMSLCWYQYHCPSPSTPVHHSTLDWNTQLAHTGTRIPDLVPVPPVLAFLINAGTPRTNIPNPILASASLEPASLPHSHKCHPEGPPHGLPIMATLFCYGSNTTRSSSCPLARKREDKTNPEASQNPHSHLWGRVE